MRHRFSIRTGLVAYLMLASQICLADDGTALAAFELTEQNYSAWRNHILPSKPDLDWQQIPWSTTFQEGILNANDRKRPLLFWTMNGHPLGCT